MESSSSESEYHLRERVGHGVIQLSVPPASAGGPWSHPAVSQYHLRERVGHGVIQQSAVNSTSLHNGVTSPTSFVFGSGSMRVASATREFRQVF